MAEIIIVTFAALLAKITATSLCHVLLKYAYTLPVLFHEYGNDV